MDGKEPSKRYHFRNVSITLIGDLIIEEYEEVQLPSDDPDPQVNPAPNATNQVVDSNSGLPAFPNFGQEEPATDESAQDEPGPHGAPQPQPLIYQPEDSLMTFSQIMSIFALRFTNRLFEDVWNKNSISSVLISRKEKSLDRDQSSLKMGSRMLHLVHLMALVCSDPMSDFGDEALTQAKLEVLKSIQTPAADDLVLGQVSGGAQQQPDYVALILKVDNDHWEGVPFILRAGTGVNEFREEIRIQLKPAKIFSEDENQLGVRNQIVLRLKPKPKFSLSTLVRPITKDDQDVPTLVPARVPLLCDKSPAEDRTADNQEEIGGIALVEEEMTEVRRILEPLNQPGKVTQYPEGSKGPTEADLLCAKAGYLHRPQW